MWYYEVISLPDEVLADPKVPESMKARAMQKIIAEMGGDPESAGLHSDKSRFRSMRLALAAGLATVTGHERIIRSTRI